MKYVSLDLETTGLNPVVHQILEIACVIEDTEKDILIKELPHFRVLVKHEIYRIDPVAGKMNWKLLERLICNGEGHTLQAALVQLQDFVQGISTFAGKNFSSFDLQFLHKADVYNCLKIKHRSLDPAILYWKKGDEGLPNLELCCLRAGISVELHNAMSEAECVIELIRRAKG